jgi:hypothetical protein
MQVKRIDSRISLGCAVLIVFFNSVRASKSLNRKQLTLRSRVLLEVIESGQEIPSLLYSPKVHYHLDKSPHLAPLRSETDPVHTLETYFFDVMLTSTPLSAKWSLPFRFSDQNLERISVTLL